jgi:hypothetical protein
MAPVIRAGRQLSKEDTARLHGHYGGAPEPPPGAEPQRTLVPLPVRVSAEPAWRPMPGRLPAQESFLGSPQGPPSTTIWATSATGRRDERAADRMRW